MDSELAPGLAADLRVLIGRLHRRLREQGHIGDLTLSQVAVLRRLEEGGPATVTALARAEGMRPQSMGANVDALEATGLVSRAADPADGRQTILSLTPACREKLRAGRLAREDWLARAIQGSFDAREQAQLAEALDLLMRVAGWEPARNW